MWTGGSIPTYASDRVSVTINYAKEGEEDNTKNILVDGKVVCSFLWNPDQEIEPHSLHMWRSWISFLGLEPLDFV